MAVDEPPAVRVLRWVLWLEVLTALLAVGFAVAELGDSSGWWRGFLVGGVVLDVAAAALFATCAVALGGGARWVLHTMTTLAVLIGAQGIGLALNGHFFAVPAAVLAFTHLRAGRLGIAGWFDA
ncbi:hypothetical protein VSH64_25375 [Amycolatopsis rhabdoformis]|uniref:DUF4233 domain-containing protein n=1 Tax=Amycolatopsis rhabdoformis TaxID=1448059 RepID=A0ABZ1HXU6_9PSEU|nr:hypothetical protein [Amycolatopsis rhabdoformis]WSE26209.1 hypothetical protein VSH64_25375 [Amycolatopsis rhabdoformis]